MACARKFSITPSTHLRLGMVHQIILSQALFDFVAKELLPTAIETSITAKKIALGVGQRNSTDQTFAAQVFTPHGGQSGVVIPSLGSYAFKEQCDNSKNFEHDLK